MSSLIKRLFSNGILLISLAVVSSCAQQNTSKIEEILRANYDCMMVGKVKNYDSNNPSASNKYRIEAYEKTEKDFYKKCGKDRPFQLVNNPETGDFYIVPLEKRADLKYK